jgi:tetratricopeptide (TPR) repeat protein
MQSTSLSLIFLGEAKLMGGCIEEAQALAESALALTRARGERGYEGWALRLFADAASAEAPADAEALYDRALARAEELGMLPLQAHCHLGRGRLWYRIGDRERARADVSASVQLFRSTAMSPWLAEAKAELLKF